MRLSSLCLEELADVPPSQYGLIRLSQALASQMPYAIGCLHGVPWRTNESSLLEVKLSEGWANGVPLPSR